jgi:hypothetical protein
MNDEGWDKAVVPMRSLRRQVMPRTGTPFAHLTDSRTTEDWLRFILSEAYEFDDPIDKSAICASPLPGSILMSALSPR